MGAKSDRITDVRRTMDDRKPQDWALWCREWRIGAGDRARGASVRPANYDRLTWAHTAYLSGYLCRGEPDREECFFDRAWKWRSESKNEVR